MAAAKAKILVVDDDADLLAQTSMILTGAGYEVISADTEDEASRLIEEGAFDLAVLDLIMEHMDSGFVLSHKIKSRDDQKPVIIVTSVMKETGLQFGAETDEERTWIAADALIHKDIRFEQLLGEVERLLGR